MNDEIKQLWATIRSHLTKRGQQIMLTRYPELAKEVAIPTPISCDDSHVDDDIAPESYRC